MMQKRRAGVLTLPLVDRRVRLRTWALPIVLENSRAYIDVSFLVVSDDDNAEWRIKTVSIARTLNMEQNQFQANNLASDLSGDLKDFMMRKIS